MDIEAFLICDAATDSNGKLNVLGAFDTIYSAEMPIVHPACSIVARLLLEPKEIGNHNLELSITHTSGEEIIPPLKGTFVLGSTDKISRANIIINVQKLKFQNFGEHRINLTIDGDPFSSIPFFVIKLQQPSKISES